MLVPLTAASSADMTRGARNTVLSVFPPNVFAIVLLVMSHIGADAVSVAVVV